MTNATSPGIRSPITNDSYRPDGSPADDSESFKKLYKGGDYGYPHTLIHDDAVHVIVSRRKEAIEVRRVEPTGRL